MAVRVTAFVSLLAIVTACSTPASYGSSERWPTDAGADGDAASLSDTSLHPHPVATSAACAALNGTCVRPVSTIGTCAGFGFEYRDAVCDVAGGLCCVTPDSAGALVPALSDYGVCGDVLCAAGNICWTGIDSEECSQELPSSGPDAGAPAGVPCGLIRCGSPWHGCTCDDEPHSRCSC